MKFERFTAGAAVRGIAGVNLLGRYLQDAGLRPVRLDGPGILDHAVRRLALPASEADRVRECISRLCESYETEAALTLVGRLAARRHALELLDNVARLQRFRAAEPGARSIPIARPVFITGLPRTGSTLLHALLDQDLQVRTPLTWEVMRLPALGESRAKSIARCARRLQWADRLAPRFRRIHPLAPELPQECIAIMAHAFRSIEFHTTHNVPGFQNWLDGDGYADAYRFHRRFLQWLQFPDKRLRWVLKAPGHLFSLDALLSEYPDAVIVQTHRDPVSVAASLASHTTVLRAAFSDEVDPAAVANDWVERWWRALELALRVRDRHEIAFRDVHYSDLLRDPLACVTKLYEELGWRLSDAARQRMATFLSRNPQDKHGRHRYALDDFGLSATAVRRRTAGYTARFDIGT